MKFSVIIGNPPYQNGKNKSFYKQFIEVSAKMVMEDGYVCLITPKAWMNGSSLWKSIRSRFTIPFINIDECGKHFDVFSSFSYALMKKSLPLNRYSTDVQFDGFMREVDIQSEDIIQMSEFGSDIDLISSIHKKLGRDGFIPFINGKGQNEFGSNGKYEVYLSSKEDRRCVYSDIKPKDYGKLKLIIAHIVEPGRMDYFSEISEKGVGRYSKYFCSEDKNELSNLQSFFDTNLYRFIDKTKRYGRWASFDIPNLDLDKKWTDEELYQHFDLADEEIAYIESKVS